MKLLILSHNCISNNNNMGKTILSVVSEFKKEELCQLYIYPSYPDCDICNSYYRITDKEVMKSIFSRQKYGCEIDKDKINNDNLLYENKEDQKIYRKKKSALRIIIREIVWKLGIYYNRQLKKWLYKEKPDYILLFPGKYCFFYKFAIKVSKDLKIPVITYFMDNYYKLSSNNVLELIHQIRLNSSIKRIIKYSKLTLTLSDEMTNFYSNEFNSNIDTLMLGSAITSKNIKGINTIKRLSYFGNMSFKRYQSLIDIGTALDEINSKYDKKYELYIYSDIYDNDILSLFKKVKSITYNGYVKGQDYLNAINNSDILLHVESFDKECIKKIKYSISTKISQIITSGKCTLVYGPSDVASISFLQKNMAAYVITDKRILKEQLLKLFKDIELRNKIIRNGMVSANKFQNSSLNSKKLYRLISEISR